MSHRRSWVVRRRAAVRRLTVLWPDTPWQAPDLESGLPFWPGSWVEVSEDLLLKERHVALRLLVASLVATLAGSLQRLVHIFTCPFHTWSDALVPLSGPLHTLRIDGSHLLAAPEVIPALGGSLTSLCIRQCDDLAAGEVECSWGLRGC